MAASLERFSQIIEGAEPPELQRLLPTIIKGVEWAEDAKTGEGRLEVHIWEEAQAAFGQTGALTRRSSGEPLVVNGSSECKDWLPKRNSIRPSRGRLTPEAWFRIVHVTLDEASSSGDYREQTVEVALGPAGAFENENMGRLTRRVNVGQVVSAVPERQRRPRRPTPPKQPRTPSVVKTLNKALDWRRQLDAGEVESQAAIARREGLTRARVTQILALLRLAPDIRKSILALAENPSSPAVSEAALRPITRIETAKQQVTAFEEAIDCRP